MDERDGMISYLFSLGLSQPEMLVALAHRGYIISQRHLRRILAALSLRRRRSYDVNEVIRFIQGQISSSGMLHGYRWMWEKCREHGHNVPRNDVQLILSMLDPSAVTFRLSRRLHRRTYIAAGPDYIWHVDGNDKLKPYGFGISGAIDGFSRHLIWLNVYTTNSDPTLIGGYFYDSIAKASGCPRLIRIDAGTENTTMKAIQDALVGNQRNGATRTFIEGTSTLNQRIECFWSHLRKQCLEFWICLFHDLKERGDFSGDFLDVNLIRFCFMAIIQDDLDQMATVWNRHKIRSSNRALPSGRPHVMYEVPIIYNTHSYLVPVSEQELRVHRDRCSFRKPMSCDEDVFEFSCSLLGTLNRDIPSTADEAKDLYLQLRAETRRMLQL